MNTLFEYIAGEFSVIESELACVESMNVSTRDKLSRFVNQTQNLIESNHQSINSKKGNLSMILKKIDALEHKIDELERKIESRENHSTHDTPK